MGSSPTRNAFLNFVCEDGGISNFWAVLNNVCDSFSTMRVGGFLLGYVFGFWDWVWLAFSRNQNFSGPGSVDLDLYLLESKG